MTKTWKIARFPAYIAASLIALFLILLLYLWISGRIWYPRQRRRVQNLTVEQERNARWGAESENRFAVSSISDNMPLNELRMIASHNSYHLEPDWIRRTLIGLVEPEEPEKLRYSHQTLTDQLENGVRSFELDVRNRSRRFTVTHVPLVDNRGPHPDLPLTLREINLWSESHTGHVPIIIIFELKSDWMFLDPGLKEWDGVALDRLDAVIGAAFPDHRLYSPDALIGSSPTLVDAIFTGWPTVGEMRGKVVCVLHTDAFIDNLYIDGDPRLTSRTMFTSKPGNSGSANRIDAVFVIHNEPDAAAISQHVAGGFIVRTRADGDGSFTIEQRNAAINSEAQIVSTDLPPGHPNNPDLGVVEFAEGKTLHRR